MDKIFDLVNKYPELNITISAKDLKEMVEFAVNYARKELEQQMTVSKTETYLTRKEASLMLGVDTSTLWRWNKVGYLTHIEVGGKRLYKESSINNILKNNENEKNRN